MVLDNLHMNQAPELKKTEEDGRLDVVVTGSGLPRMKLRTRFQSTMIPGRPAATKDSHLDVNFPRANTNFQQEPTEQGGGVRKSSRRKLETRKSLPRRTAAAIIQESSNESSGEDDDEDTTSFTDDIQELSEGASTPGALTFLKLKDRAVRFPEQVYCLVMDTARSNPSVIHWIADGSAFIINERNKKLKSCLSKHFKHGKYSSLQRQLNMYGFKKHLSGRFDGAFHHEHFHRDESTLESLALIQRRPPPNRQSSAYKTRKRPSPPKASTKTRKKRPSPPVKASTTKISKKRPSPPLSKSRKTARVVSLSPAKKRAWAPKVSIPLSMSPSKKSVWAPTVSMPLTRTPPKQRLPRLLPVPPSPMDIEAAASALVFFAATG